MSAIADLWPQLAFEADSFSGRLEIRQDQDGDLLLALEDLEGDIPEMESESSISIVSLAGDDAVVLAGEEHLVMQVRGKPFCVSAGSFFQTNFTGAETLVSLVEELVLAQSPKNLLDVYCGVGLFSAFLADKVEQLAGIESSPSACRDFALNLDAFDNVSLYEGAAEQVLPGLDFKADGVVIDPPRAGLHRMARQALLEHSPDFIVYVSCNPSTLARDVKHFLKAGYKIEKTTLVDMFPQTYHIESVVLMRKAEK
jgi:23S rRNA (uracil1939-C5)-methyltransferase